MYLLGLGIVLLVLKYLGISTVATWEWWQVLIPFGLAVLWWSWADWSGYTQRKTMSHMAKVKQNRVDKKRTALGLKKSRK